MLCSRFCFGPREPEEKCGWCMRSSVIDAPPLLAKASIYPITTLLILMTVYLLRSRCLVLRGPYWLHTETVSYDEWIPAKSKLEINRPAAVSLGLCDGWINMVIKWEVATMSPCRFWQAEPGSACNGVKDTKSSCTYRVSLTSGIYIYHRVCVSVLFFPTTCAMQ